MTNERLKEIFETGEKLERVITKKLGIKENTTTLEKQGITEEMLKQFDTSPLYIGEYKDQTLRKGTKVYTYMGARKFDDPVIKLYFIRKLIYAGYPEEYPVPDEELLFEIPKNLRDCGKNGTYIGGKGCRYINKEDLEDLEKHFTEIQKMRA